MNIDENIISKFKTNCEIKERNSEQAKLSLLKE